MSQSTPQNKESSVKTVDKEKSKSSDAVSKDNQAAKTNVTKTNVTNKSASQNSISHFSSVTTPEYREGWNRIFGGDKSKIKLTTKNTPQGLGLQKLSIYDEDLDPETRITLHKVFKKYALKKGVDIAIVEGIIDEAYSLEYCVKKK